MWKSIGMKIVINILLSLCLALPAYGNCEKNVTYLEKGKSIPCTGYLFSPEQELKVRLKVKLYDSVLAYSDKQGEINELLNKRLIEYQKYNVVLSNEISSQKERTFWNNTLYFAVGVILTGVIAVNVNR